MRKQKKREMALTCKSKKTIKRFEQKSEIQSFVSKNVGTENLVLFFFFSSSSPKKYIIKILYDLPRW